MTPSLRPLIAILPLLLLALPAEASRAPRAGDAAPSGVCRYEEARLRCAEARARYRQNPGDVRARRDLQVSQGDVFALGRELERLGRGRAEATRLLARIELDRQRAIVERELDRELARAWAHALRDEQPLRYGERRRELERAFAEQRRPSEPGREVLGGRRGERLAMLPSPRVR